MWLAVEAEIAREMRGFMEWESLEDLLFAAHFRRLEEHRETARQSASLRRAREISARPRRQCAGCGALYRPERRAGRVSSYCGEACKQAAAKREAKLEMRRRTAAKRRQARKAPLAEILCIVCGSRFSPPANGGNVSLCSDACRRARKQEQERRRRQ